MIEGKYLICSTLLCISLFSVQQLYDFLQRREILEEVFDKSSLNSTSASESIDVPSSLRNKSLEGTAGISLNSTRGDGGAISSLTNKSLEEAVLVDTSLNSNSTHGRSDAPFSLSNNGTRIKTISNGEKQRGVDNNKPRGDKKQRIVLIAGPHKTASSSIQANMYRWTSTTSSSTSSTPLLNQWSWPFPEVLFNDCNEDSKKEFMHGKIFYPFVEALNNCRIRKNRAVYAKYTCQELLNIYKNEFQRQWNEGYNLVIGTEAFDLVGGISSMEPGNGRKNSIIYMSDVLDYLPTQNKRDITIVVKYRSPRTKHLISWYHECCMKQMTFAAFLKNEMTRFPDRGSRIIDSLHLVHTLVNDGYKVSLVDYSGVVDSEYDISNVIACDVLNANCTDSKELVGEMEPPKVTNVKEGDKHFGTFEEKDMRKLERIIRKRDCYFQGIEDHPLVELLYPKDYRVVMDGCKGEGITRQQMNKEILQLVQKAGRRNIVSLPIHKYQ